MNRLPFLDWTRGFAVLIMIQCHTFNCLVRPELRDAGPYVLSQFIGGMAAVLFLFLAGITFAFQMDRLDRYGATRGRKMASLLRRAGYLVLLAYVFRANNSLMKWPPPWHNLLKVDILNCMGASMALAAALALWSGRARAQAAALAGLAVACASPLVSGIDWSGVPVVIRDYLVPNRAAFPLFPWSAYLAFGVSAGTLLRSIRVEGLERTLQWGVLVGFGLVFGGQYFSNIPYSVYAKSNFWTDSPALVLIRVGLSLLALGGAYLWTEHLASKRWSWVQSMGKTSLLVYWVHVLLVYGWMAERWKQSFGIPESLAATAGVVLLMLLLSVARLKWAAARKPRPAREPLAMEASA